MSVSEFRDWQTFYFGRPFGDEALDHQIAVLTMIVANMFKTKDSQPFTVDDFRQVTRNRVESESPKTNEADKFRTRKQKA